MLLRAKLNESKFVDLCVMWFAEIYHMCTPFRIPLVVCTALLSMGVIASPLQCAMPCLPSNSAVLTIKAKEAKQKYIPANVRRKTNMKEIQIKEDRDPLEQMWKVKNPDSEEGPGGA